MIVIVAGKTVKGPVLIKANSEEAEPLSSDSASAMVDPD